MSACDRYVYGLRGEYGRLIYVGVGKGRRMHQHMCQARRGVVGKHNPAKGQYLIDCLAGGIAVSSYKIAERLTIDEACTLEREIIDLLGRLDLGTGPLLNANSGGFGCHNPAPSTRAKLARAARGKSPSPETRVKMGAAFRGLKRSPETRAKMAEVSRKRQYSPETRAKMAENARNRSPEHRAKIAEAARNRSPEHYQKTSAARRGLNFSPEWRANISASHRGGKRSPETRAKMSESARRQWATRKPAISDLFSSVEATHVI